MRLLEKIKALIGLGNGAQSEKRRDSVDVTVEREPDRKPDRESGMGTSEPGESAVGGAQRELTESEAETEPEEGPESTPEPEPESEQEPEQAPDPKPEPAAEPDSAPDPAPDTDGAETAPPTAEAEQPTTEAGSATPESGNDEPLDSIKGIGPSYAERLENAGIGSVSELAAADPEALAGETGLSEKRISRWVDRAQQG